jgi:hypothetical protein
MDKAAIDGHVKVIEDALTRSLKADKQRAPEKLKQDLELVIAGCALFANFMTCINDVATQAREITDLQRDTLTMIRERP